MRCLQLNQTVLAILLSLTIAPDSQALTINLQYPSSPLFSSSLDSVAKQAINAAAFDLSSAVTTTLKSITTDAYSGSFGGVDITLDFLFSYNDPLSDPESNPPVAISNATIGTNAVNLVIGARNLEGDTLAVSSPGFVQLQDISGGGIYVSGLSGAVNIAESKAQTAYKRGAGPVVSSAEGIATLDTVSADVDVDFGITYGSLSFDWDSNDNGARDTDAQLSNYWHFDHTTTVAAGKNDLYSVALHEMIHTLGVGSSATWDSKVSGSSWTGSRVVAITGSGANLINSAGNHAAEGLMSRRISDGMPQEVVIDPTITTGTRKSLTELDLAFLRDLGHTTIIPNFPSLPGDFNGDGDVDSSDLLTWQNYYSAGANGDADSDGDTDGRDFLLWQRNYTAALALTAVPEPNSAILILTLTTLLPLHRRKRCKKTRNKKRTGIIEKRTGIIQNHCFDC